MAGLLRGPGEARQVAGVDGAGPDEVVGGREAGGGLAGGELATEKLVGGDLVEPGRWVHAVAGEDQGDALEALVDEGLVTGQRVGGHDAPSVNSTMRQITSASFTAMGSGW